MKVNYQPIVVDNATKMFKVLEEENFFNEFQINDKKFVLDYFCEFFTEKFIKGECSDTDMTISFEEMEKCLLDITIKDTLYSLTKEGVVNVIEDENNEEQFFLTKLGKDIVKKME